MKVLCPLFASAILASGVFLAASPVRAEQPFLYVDEYQRLPADPPPHPVFGFPDTLDVDMADVDGDGDLDLFYAEGSAGPFGFQNQLYINDGTGHFANETAARVPFSLSNSSEVELADVDCDGDLDAAFSNVAANELLLNDGNGFFTDATATNLPPTPVTPPWAQPPFFLEISAEVRFFDADGDGDGDLFVSNENPFNPAFDGGAQNRLLINSGNCSGVFVESFSALPFITDQTSGVAPSDLDGDGDTDLVVLNVGPNYVLMNRLVETGGAFLHFERVDTLGPNANSTRKGVLGDLDGDGCVDLFEANSREQPDNVYFGDCTGSFALGAGAMPAIAQSNTDVDLADFDGDGDQDAYTTSPGGFLSNHGFLGGQNRYFVNDGNGFFEEHTFPNFPTFIDTSTNAELGDVDGDGDLDLAIANSGAGPLDDPTGRLDRLMIRHSCEDETLFCLSYAVDSLGGEVDALDTSAYPDGDFTSSSTTVNTVRKAQLQSLVSVMESLLDEGLGHLIGLELLAIEARVDGEGGPADWVAGEAAARLLGWVEFALCVLDL